MEGNVISALFGECSVLVLEGFLEDRKQELAYYPAMILVHIRDETKSVCLWESV